MVCDINKSQNATTKMGQKSYIWMLFQTQISVSDVWVEHLKNWNGMSEIDDYSHDDDDVWIIEVVEKEERNKEFEVPLHEFRVLRI